MDPLDWHPLDYLEAGRKYLAAMCEEANRISQDEIGYWDARSFYGTLGDTIETIAFDWKISPQSILDENDLPVDV